MIRQVRGTVITVGSDFLVIEIGNAVAGIGLRIFAPEPTAARFRAGDSLSLFTHLQVRENELSLYGFEELDELVVFEALLGVSRVGPKVALATLSTLTPDALRLAVANKEPGIVARVPGIGERTAEKVIVDLKDKLAPVEGEMAALATTLDADAEVMEALTGLGYSVVEAQRALQQIPDDITGVEERLRMALIQFSD